jgi:hypothetical protein
MEILTEPRAIEKLLSTYGLAIGTLMRFVIGKSVNEVCTPIIVEPSNLVDRVCGGHKGLVNFARIENNFPDFLGGNCTLDGHSLLFDPNEFSHQTAWILPTLEEFNFAKNKFGVVAANPGYYPSSSKS